jgi:predicted nucleic acid-binding protein
MPSTLIDTNVLLDVLEERAPWSKWALGQFQRLVGDGDLLINQVIYGEASVPYASLALFDDLLPADLVRRENLPWDATFIAGKAHEQYRKRGGQRRSTLPDFFIGAHAAVSGYRVLTRDAAPFRTYFPEVEVIAPDTHP